MRKRAALFDESDSDTHDAVPPTREDPLRRTRDAADATAPVLALQHTRATMSTLFAANEALARPTSAGGATTTSNTMMPSSSSVDDMLRYTATTTTRRGETAPLTSSTDAPLDAYETVLQERVQAYRGDAYQGTCLAAICVPRSRTDSQLGPKPILMLTAAAQAEPTTKNATTVLARLELTADAVVSPSEDNPQYMHILDPPLAGTPAQALSWWSLMFPSTQAATTCFITCLVVAKWKATTVSSQMVAGRDANVLWSDLEQDAETDTTGHAGHASALSHVETWCGVWHLVPGASRLGPCVFVGSIEDGAAAKPEWSCAWDQARRCSMFCQRIRKSGRRVCVVHKTGSGEGVAPAVVYVIVRSCAVTRPPEQAPASASTLALTAPPPVLTDAAPPSSTSHAQLADVLAQLLSASAARNHTYAYAGSATPPAVAVDEALRLLRDRVEALHDKVSRLDVDARLQVRNAELLTEVKQLLGLAPRGAVEVEDAMKDRQALLAAVERYKEASQEATRNYERALESIGRYSERERDLQADLTTQKEAGEARVAELNERHRLLTMEARTRHLAELETQTQQAYDKGLAEGMRRGRLDVYPGTFSEGSGEALLSPAVRKQLQAAEAATAQAKLATEEAKLRHEQDRRTLLGEITVLQQLCEKLKQQHKDPQIPEDDASGQVKRLKRALNAVYTNAERRVLAQVETHETQLSAAHADIFLGELVSAVKEESKLFVAEIHEQAALRQREQSLLRELMEARRATARLAAATDGPPPPPMPPPALSAVDVPFESMMPPPPPPPAPCTTDHAEQTESAAASTHHASPSLLPPLAPSFEMGRQGGFDSYASAPTDQVSASSSPPTAGTPVHDAAHPARPTRFDRPESPTAMTQEGTWALPSPPPRQPASDNADESGKDVPWTADTWTPMQAQSSHNLESSPPTATLTGTGAVVARHAPWGSLESTTERVLWRDDTQTGEAALTEADEADATPPRRLAIQLTP